MRRPWPCAPGGTTVRSCRGPEDDGDDDDGYGSICDNCPDVASSDVSDTDGDGVGDVCDNCVEIANPDQTDSNGNQIGDACEFCCVNPTGNADNDPGGIADLSDILYMANAVFLGGSAIECPAEANTDGDPGCVIDLSDILWLAGSVFLGGPANADCQIDCEV